MYFKYLISFPGLATCGTKVIHGTGQWHWAMVPVSLNSEEKTNALQCAVLLRFLRRLRVLNTYLTYNFNCCVFFQDEATISEKQQCFFLIENNSKLLNNDTIDNTLLNFMQSILTKCFHWIFPNFYMLHQNDTCFLTKKYIQNMNGFMVYLYHQAL